MAENVLYFKIPSLTQNGTQIKAKIAALDLIISSLYDTAMKSVSTGNMVEYEIDTGQTKQRVQYSTLDTVTNAIASYEKLRQMLVNKLSPRSFQLRDSKNFTRR